MSEPKLISPMLDGFLMGTPISDHNGVVCCPAMKENSDHKYIVKVISVPASQKQLDALLLAGAYKSPADAIDYFKAQADDIVAEAQTLQALSRLDGFVPYEQCQIVPMDRNAMGYEVYLLSTYKRSLEKHMRTTMLTHLEAINLGLDMCTALATVRRAGYIYVALKPTNIFMSEDKSFRIGDLGFIALDTFSYASMPGKYISAYTPPELRDPMQTMNQTADTFGLGMVLYQVYNDGQLPKEPEDPSQGYETPCNADYELAEIILKALSPKVEDRYQDPQEMGQALATYLQKNNVNATPVTPASAVFSDPADIVPPEEPVDLPEELMAEPTLEECEKEEVPQDETLPTPEDAPKPTEPVTISDEVSKIVAQADALIVHEAPKGVEVPEACKDPFENFDPEAKVDWTQVEDYLPDPLHEMMEKKKPPVKVKQKPKKPRNWMLISIVSALSLVLVMTVGILYFLYGYTKTVDDLSINGTLTSITVKTRSTAKEGTLTAVCTDAYGNDIRQPLVNGETVFENLQADSLYRINLEIEGFHRLAGKVQGSFTTEARTSITSFDAVVGAENGSVELTFTTTGQEPSEWIMIYGTETEETKKQVFYGHSCTIKNLTVDKTYHFELKAGGDTKLIGGGNTLDFLAVNVLLAENVRVTADGPTTLAVHWDAPEGSDVKSWKVRCYDGEGYDESVEVVSREAHFTNINTNQSYIVEVIADGMTQEVRATITDNPITVTNFQVNNSSPDQIVFTWDYEGTPPKDGWLVSYRMDEGPRKVVIPCEDESLTLSLVVPSATYNLDIRSATGVSTFQGIHAYRTPDPGFFNRFGFDASTVETNLVKSGENKDTITAEDFQTSFRLNSRISLFMHTNKNFEIPDEEVRLQYVLRDEEGNVQTRSVATETLSWKSIWEGSNYHDGKLDLPVTPNKAGKYSITVYADGMLLATANFTVTNR